MAYSLLDKNAARRHLMNPNLFYIASGPCPIHESTIATALGINYGTSESDMVLRWGSGTKAGVFIFPTPAMAKDVETARKHGKVTIAYWIGSDAYRVARDRVYQRRLPKFDMNLCVHERLQVDLHDARIRSEVLYLPVRDVPAIVTQEVKSQVAVYMPSNKGNYKCALVCEIAESIKSLPFVFYGSNDLPALPSNVTNVGRLSTRQVTDVLRSASVILRLTNNDGFPSNIIEAKMLGKQVVCNYPYKGVIYGAQPKQVVEILSKEETHKPDTSDAVQWYRDECSPSAFKKRLTHYLTQFIESAGWVE